MERRLHQAIKHAGNMNALAKSLGTSRQRIHNYTVRGLSEQGHEMIMAYLAKNKIKAAPRGATLDRRLTA